MWRAVAAAEAAGIKRKLCMEKKVWGSRKGHDRQVSTASVRRIKTQMLGRATPVFPHVTAKSLAVGLQSCTRISTTDRMPSPRNSYLRLAPLQTDRQTNRRLHVYSSLYHVALSLAFSLSFSRSLLLLCWMPDLHSSASSSSPSMISPHQSKGPKDPPLSDLITLDNRFQLHYKDSRFQLHTPKSWVSITLQRCRPLHLKLCRDASHFHLKLCFGSGLENRFELYYKR